MLRTRKVDKQIQETLERIRDAGVLDEATVLLSGSYARGVGTHRSDIDITVITPGQRKRLRVPIEVHLHSETREKFVRRLKNRDDFPNWVFRFGRVIHDPSGWWEKLKSNPNLSKIWPNWKLKVPQAKRRLERVTDMLQIGDRAATEEQLLLATVLVSRAYLLKQGVFPLSRPELPRQLRQGSQKELAEMLEMLQRNGFRHTSTTEQLQKNLERILKELQGGRGIGQRGYRGKPQ